MATTTLPNHGAPERPASTDALFDTTPPAMAARFGARAIDLLRHGRDPREAARLAASFAFQVDPTLREGHPGTVIDGHFIWRLGTELNAATRDHLTGPS